MDGGRGVFTLSTEPFEGIMPRSALAFNVGVAAWPLMGVANFVLGSILGAGWTVF